MVLRYLRFHSGLSCSWFKVRRRACVRFSADARAGQQRQVQGPARALRVPGLRIFHRCHPPPRLYIPFLGWGKFLLAAAGFVSAVAIGLWGESVPALRWSWFGQGGALAVLGGLSLVLLSWGSRRRLPVSLSPERDLPALGLLASLWRYWQQGRRRPDAQSPMGALEGAGHAPVLPHLVSVQSESLGPFAAKPDELRPARQFVLVRRSRAHHAVGLRGLGDTVWRSGFFPVEYRLWSIHANTGGSGRA